MSTVPQPRKHHLRGIRRASIDYEHGLFSVVLDDLIIHTHRLSQRFEPSVVRRIDLDIPSLAAEFRTASGAFTVELGGADSGLSTPAAYLDQNHWIDFARWEIDPSLISREKAAVFSLLHESTAEGRLLLPASSANFVETFHRGLTKREDLVNTILKNSRGWQLRDAVAVRRLELLALFGAALPTFRCSTNVDLPTSAAPRAR